MRLVDSLVILWKIINVYRLKIADCYSLLKSLWMKCREMYNAFNVLNIYWNLFESKEHRITGSLLFIEQYAAPFMPPRPSTGLSKVYSVSSIIQRVSLFPSSESLINHWQVYNKAHEKKGIENTKISVWNCSRCFLLVYFQSCLGCAQPPNYTGGVHRTRTHPITASRLKNVK